jgi:hypothetical protein
MPQRVTALAAGHNNGRTTVNSASDSRKTNLASAAVRPTPQNRSGTSSREEAVKVAAVRRRFGRVRKLPSGRWQARYPGPDGADRTAPTTFATKTDAARFLAATEVDMGRGVWLDPMRSGVTLHQYSEAWLGERTVRGRPLAVRTRETYRHSLDRWVLPTLGNLPLDRITPAAVRRWHAQTSASTGRTATRQAYAILRAVLSTAVADDALARNPCRIAGAGQARTEERPLLDLEQVQQLAAGMPGHLRGLVDLAFGHTCGGESCWRCGSTTST